MLRNTLFIKPEPDTSPEVDLDINDSSDFDSKETALELPIDLIQTPGHLIVRCPIAGAGIHDIEISLSTERLTLKKHATIEDPEKVTTYHYQECFWGELERDIDLPKPVDPDRTRASLQDGILVVTMPIASRTNSKVIHIQE